MLNKLLLLSGNDIPFTQAQLIIHQPKIKQIALIGQRSFYTGCEYLNFSKEKLDEQDKNHLQQYSNFEVLMTIMRNSNASIEKGKVSMQLVLLLLFPEYKISFLPRSIMLSKQDQQGKVQQHFIEESNFQSFKNIVSQMFCLNQIHGKKSKKYNPGGPQARALVKKFQKREQQLAKIKNQGKEKTQISILAQYISILEIGLKQDINLLMQYTIYQLFEAFRRFRAKEEYDIYVRAKLAGAENLDEIQNWMGELNPE